MKIGLLGDVFLAGDYGEWPEGECETALSGLRPLLAGNDLTVANFEGVLVDSLPERIGRDKVVLPVRHAYARALADAGIDVVSLSNNHVFDLGLDGFDATTRHLSAAGVGFFGAGRSIDDAASLDLRTIGGVVVGLLGLTCETTHPTDFAGSGPGVARLQDAEVEPRIARAKAHCNLLVVSVHWGDEHVSWPSPEQLRVARRLVDAGADIVAGHHAHVFQGCERYRHGLIAYGLGNVSISALRERVRRHGVEHEYVFSPRAVHRQGVAVSVNVDQGRVVGHELHTFFIGDDGRPVPRANRLRRASYGLKRTIWHLPGYASFYRALTKLQFRVAPKLRALTRMQSWRRVLGRLKRRSVA